MISDGPLDNARGLVTEVPADFLVGLSENIGRDFYHRPSAIFGCIVSEDNLVNIVNNSYNAEITSTLLNLVFPTLS